MVPVDFRPATRDHAGFILALREAGVREHVDRSRARDAAEQAARCHDHFDPARYQLIVVEGRPIGALAVEWRDDDVFLADIEIAPEWRGRGIGTAIVVGLLAEARQRGLPMTLQVLRGTPARRLYERLGFEASGETATHVLMRVMPAGVDDASAPIGLWRGAVRLVPHHPAWAGRFAAEAERLRAALGEPARAIEHVGSTAVPGLPAKPILDIMVGIASLDTADEEIRALEALGYERHPRGDLPGRRYLVLGDGDIRRVHLSLCEPSSRFWREHIAFRERLRADAEVAAAYARLKQELAGRYPNDRLAYTAGKDDFIASVLAASPRAMAARRA